MNDLTIDLSNAPTIAPKIADPWTERIELDVERVIRDGDGNVLDVFSADVVHIDLDKPLKHPREAQHFRAAFGPRCSFATLEAVRAWMRERIEWDNLSAAERLDRDIEWMRQSERDQITQCALMRSVCADPGMNFRALAEHMRANGWTGKDDEIRAAATELLTGDYGDVQPLVVVDGARRAKLHYPGEGVSADAWSEEERVASETGDAADDQAIDL